MKKLFILFLVLSSFNLFSQCPTNVDYDFSNSTGATNGTVFVDNVATTLPQNLGSGGNSCLCDIGTSAGSNCFEFSILNLPANITSLDFDLDASNAYVVDPTSIAACTVPINTNLTSGTITFSAGTVPTILVCKSSGSNLTIQRFDFVQTALPVELTSFEAKSMDISSNQLLWQTSSETNNVGFDIERSGNGTQWEAIDFVPGIGTTNTNQSYSFIDHRPITGYNYYRLKQIDYDGKFEYSNIQSVLTGSSKHADLQVFPNPNDGQFTLSLIKPSYSDASIRIYGSEGNLVWQKYLRPTEELGFWKNDLILPKGKMYYVVTYVAGEVITKKIISKNNK